MIVAVDLNPSLDRTLTVKRLEPAAVSRAHAVRLDPGGKAVNVARALNAWGLPVLGVVLLGGSTGSGIARLLERERVPYEPVPVDGESRSNIVIIDEACGSYIKVNEPGPSVAAEELDALQDRILRRVTQGDLWVFSGRLPLGLPEDTCYRLINLVQSRGARAFFDSSGKPFALGVGACPYLVKPNHLEAEELIGRPVRTTDDAVAAVRELWHRNIEAVAITRGAEGAVVGYHGTIVEASPPALEVAAPVGAGDASMAALVWSVFDRLGPVEMARLAVAAGAATAVVPGSGVATLGQVEAMRQRVEVKVLCESASRATWGT